MNATRFRDFYGCAASIDRTHGGKFRLCVSNGYGRRMADKTFGKYRDARIALGGMGRQWREVM